VGWPEATRESGNGEPAGVEDETDSPGPLDREIRGRRPARKARIKRENVLPQIRYRHAGRVAWAGLWASAYGRREASGGQLGQRPSGPHGRAGRN
jgi:hypothetical protein